MPDGVPLFLSLPLYMLRFFLAPYSTEEISLMSSCDVVGRQPTTKSMWLTILTLLRVLHNTTSNVQCSGKYDRNIFNNKNCKQEEVNKVNERKLAVTLTANYEYLRK
ncbi:CLUMA_CG014568, isoform A [Clunio marinus]|uniref:CLUMA_CG014568, isoform A n=1 Tax=Clunio marinus TaxID=568069 RepID=A0A1J1IST4_9DIPT|nr:CLUMA_CG014568, isoform A [Clunio marinus]